MLHGSARRETFPCGQQHIIAVSSQEHRDGEGPSAHVCELLAVQVTDCVKFSAVYVTGYGTFSSWGAVPDASFFTVFEIVANMHPPEK